MVGMTKCCQVPLPETGSHLARTASQSISTRATKKVGKACATTVTAMASRSTQVLRQMADAIPKGKASSKPNNRAHKPSVMVTGSFCSTRSATGILK